MRYLDFWRHVRGKTQKQIAKEIGISQGHYCDIEKRGKKPRPGVYEPLSVAIGRPIEEVVGKLNGVNPSEMSIPAPSAK